MYQNESVVLESNCYIGPFYLLIVNLYASGDATVTIAHRHTPKEQLKIHTQLADIVIVAAGNVVNTTKNNV